MPIVERTKSNSLIATMTNQVRSQKKTLRINIVMETYRISTTGRVL